MQRKPTNETYIEDLIKRAPIQENSDMVHVNLVADIPRDYYIAIKTIALKEQMKLKDLIAGIVTKFVDDYRQSNKDIGGV